MRSLWEHILLEAADEKNYPTYVANTQSIWTGIKYKSIEGASEAIERCNQDPAGLLKDLGVGSITNDDALNETDIIEDLYGIYEKACKVSDLSQIVLKTAMVQNASGEKKAVKITLTPQWKEHYLGKDKKPQMRKSMQICCFWMKSIAVAAFRDNRVKSRQTLDDRTKKGEEEGNLRVEIVESDDVILVYLAKRIEQWKD